LYISYVNVAFAMWIKIFSDLNVTRLLFKNYVNLVTVFFIAIEFWESYSIISNYTLLHFILNELQNLNIFVKIFNWERLYIYIFFFFNKIISEKIKYIIIYFDALPFFDKYIVIPSITLDTWCILIVALPWTKQTIVWLEPRFLYFSIFKEKSTIYALQERVSFQ